MEAKINNLISLISSINNEETEAHLLNYTCVLISGYLEKNIQDILGEYKKTDHCKIHECKDTIASMKKIQNAKWCVIRPIVMNIDEKILSELKTNLTDFEQITDSIDNMVKTRHKVAHGDNVTTLTLNILKDDFSNIKLFIDKLKKIFLNFD